MPMSTLLHMSRKGTALLLSVNCSKLDRKAHMFSTNFPSQRPPNYILSTAIYHIHCFYSFSFELVTHAGYWGQWRFSSHLCQELLHRLRDSLPSDLVLHPSERSVLMSFTTMFEVSTGTFWSTEAILTDVPPATVTTDQSINPPINQLTHQLIYQSRTRQCRHNSEPDLSGNRNVNKITAKS